MTTAGLVPSSQTDSEPAAPEPVGPAGDPADRSLPSPPARPDRPGLKAHPEVRDRRRAVVSPGPPTARWVIEEIAGAEGHEVDTAQAKAIEELLRWWIEEHERRHPAGP